MELNCDVWADADFGHGKVEIRCTKTGPHEFHTCNVLLRTPDTVKEEKVQHDHPSRRNVFEGKDGN